MGDCASALLVNSLKIRSRARSSRSEGEAPFRSISVILIGPSGLSKEGLQQVLKAYHFRGIVGAPTLEAVNAAAFSKARLVIMSEPSTEADLPQMVRALRADNPALRFVLLVDVNDRDKVESALRVPAHAFLSQRIGCDALIKALEVVLADGAVFFSMDLMTHLLSRAQEAPEQPAPEASRASPSLANTRPLSDREVDILHCLTDGASNKLIARRFEIAESTVKIHVKGILRKINAQNRTQAAIWALAHLPPLGSPATAGSQDDTRLGPRSRLGGDGRLAVASRHQRAPEPLMTAGTVASKM